MGVNHGGTGGTNPPEFAVGTLIQVVPPDFCHVSKFQALAMDSSPPQISTQIYATARHTSVFACALCARARGSQSIK
jgi:hypothetical protein